MDVTAVHLVQIPSGFATSQQPVPTEITEHDLNRYLMAKVKLPKQKLKWQLGKITRHFKPGQPW